MYLIKKKKKNYCYACGTRLDGTFNHFCNKPTDRQQKEEKKFEHKYILRKALPKQQS